MFNILNKKGTASLGLIVSVFIVVLLFFGSFYFFNNNLKNNPEAKDLDVGDNIIDTLNNAQKNIDNINKKTEEENNTLAKENFISSELEKWHKLERKDDNFILKYPQGWYYVIKHKDVLDSEYNLMIGFEPSSVVWNQNPPYSIELIIPSEDYKNNPNVYQKEIILDRKKYIIRTSLENKEEYGPYIDQMIKTLKKIN